MPVAFKGSVEDIISTTLTVILMSLFAIAMIISYQDYLKRMDMGEQLNFANNLAGKIFFENNGIITNTTQNLSPSNNIKVVLVDVGRNATYVSGSISQNVSSLISSQLSILFYYSNESKYFPGRLEVYVGR